jgi:hypothetical protein
MHQVPVETSPYSNDTPVDIGMATNAVKFTPKLSNYRQLQLALLRRLRAHAAANIAAVKPIPCSELLPHVRELLLRALQF